MFFLGRRDRLRYCPECRSGLACPTDLADHDDTHKRIELRCPECGHEWDTVVNHARAELLGHELDRDATAIQRALDRLDLERMAVYAETFTAALARDLIEPTDFAA